MWTRVSVGETGTVGRPEKYLCVCVCVCVRVCVCVCVTCNHIIRAYRYAGGQTGDMQLGLNRKRQ